MGDIFRNFDDLIHAFKAQNITLGFKTKKNYDRPLPSHKVLINALDDSDS